MTISITESFLENTALLVEEVKNAFNTSIPPICISISNKADVACFAKVFKSSEHCYLGKRILCKSATSFAPSTFAAAEIYLLEDEKFPIQLSFKSISEIEDFADGYLQAVDSTPAPTSRMLGNNISVVAEKTEEKPRKKPSRRDPFEVNPFAESLLDTMLKILLGIGWALAIATLIVFFIIALDMGQSYMAILGLLSAAVILIGYYAIWALNKVIINISRTLYNINENLKVKND